MRFDEFSDRLSLEKRHITREHNDTAVKSRGQSSEGKFNCAACAGLIILINNHRSLVVLSHSPGNLISFVTNHCNDHVWSKRHCSVKDMPNEWHAAERVQDLWK
jgi:hypothetical protein